MILTDKVEAVHPPLQGSMTRMGTFRRKVW